MELAEEVTPMHPKKTRPFYDSRFRSYPSRKFGLTVWELSKSISDPGQLSSQLSQKARVRAHQACPAPLYRPKRSSGSWKFSAPICLKTDGTDRFCLPKHCPENPKSPRPRKVELCPLKDCQDGRRAVKRSVWQAITPEPLVVERCGLDCCTQLDFCYPPNVLSGLKTFRSRKRLKT